MASYDVASNICQALLKEAAWRALTTAPESPGVPRGVALTILGSVPTALGRTMPILLATVSILLATSNEYDDTMILNSSRKCLNVVDDVASTGTLCGG